MLGKASGWSRADVRHLTPGVFEEYLTLAVEEEQRRMPQDILSQLLPR